MFVRFLSFFKQAVVPLQKRNNRSHYEMFGVISHGFSTLDRLSSSAIIGKSLLRKKLFCFSI